MFRHTGNKEIVSNAFRNGNSHYKIYSYIATFSINEMINQRIRIASEWLDNPSSILHAKTLYEANQSIHQQQYDLIITDNDSYYKLIAHLPVFKVKIEKDFFSDEKDPLLNSKPLYYHPKKNTLFIRENSAHNSRLLYEILKLALTPPIISIKTHKILDEKNHLYFKQLRDIIYTIFPYTQLYNKSMALSYANQVATPSYPILQCNIEPINAKKLAIDNIENDFYKNIYLSIIINNKNTKITYNASKKIKTTLSKKHNLINYLWEINAILEKKGYLSLYNDAEEIARYYSQHK
jgi:hypothetical protein